MYLGMHLQISQLEVIHIDTHYPFYVLIVALRFTFLLE